MRTLKYKHLSFEDRCAIQEYLNLGYNFTQIGKVLKKHRTTIAKEVYIHRFLRRVYGNKEELCFITKKAPYVCNACKKFNHCKKIRYSYDASIAYNEYLKELSESRSRVFITKEQISNINEKIAPLMLEKHHSVNQVFINHPELLPFSKPTFYRYIDLGLLNVKNIDLQRKVKFRVKKEYDRTKERVNTEIKLERFYTDFQDYIELHPNCSIVEMDTVIGTSGGKGGKCFLTLLFRKFNFMLIFLLPYKKSQHVTETFDYIKNLIGIENYKKLFEVILTDNGTEFSDPLSIEVDFNTGEKIVNLFYCDPNCSWQKGSIEKNHEYIRYVLPKGTSFAGLTQEDCELLASHINSVPRVSLNNNTPYDIAALFIGTDIIDKFNIKKIPYDDVNLSHKLFK